MNSYFDRFKILLLVIIVFSSNLIVCGDPLEPPNGGGGFEDPGFDGGDGDGVPTEPPIKGGGPGGGGEPQNPEPCPEFELVWLNSPIGNPYPPPPCPIYAGGDPQKTLFIRKVGSEAHSGTQLYTYITSVASIEVDSDDKSSLGVCGGQNQGLHFVFTFHAPDSKIYTPELTVNVNMLNYPNCPATITLTSAPIEVLPAIFNLTGDVIISNTGGQTFAKSSPVSDNHSQDCEFGIDFNNGYYHRDSREPTQVIQFDSIKVRGYHPQYSNEPGCIGCKHVTGLGGYGYPVDEFYNEVLDLDYGDLVQEYIFPIDPQAVFVAYNDYATSNHQSVNNCWPIFDDFENESFFEQFQHRVTVYQPRIAPCNGWIHPEYPYYSTPFHTPIEVGAFITPGEAKFALDIPDITVAKLEIYDPTTPGNRRIFRHVTGNQQLSSHEGELLLGEPGTGKVYVNWDGLFYPGNGTNTTNPTPLIGCDYSMELEIKFQNHHAGGLSYTTMQFSEDVGMPCPHLSASSTKERGFTLLSVEFMDSGDGLFVPIEPDPGYHVAQFDPSTTGTTTGYIYPHYNDNGVHWDRSLLQQGFYSSPVAYSRTATPKVRVKIQIDSTVEYDDIDSISIMGIGLGPDVVTFPPTIVNPGSANNIIISEIEAQHPLLDTIHYSEKFEIVWSVTYQKSGSPITAIVCGHSWNEFYVIGNKELEPGTPTWHTVVHLGTKGAHGMSIDPTSTASTMAVADAIFDSQFAGLCVVKRGFGEDDCMQYWGEYATNNQVFSVEDLLEHGDGRCGAWARFLLRVYKTQGINNAYFYDIVPKDLSFLTENYQYSQEHYELRDLLLQFLSLDRHETGIAIKHWTSGIFDPNTSLIDSIPFQGQNGNPTNRFNVHSLIVLIDAQISLNLISQNQISFSETAHKIFDPSYGSAKNSLGEWEEYSLSYIPVILRNENGDSLGGFFHPLVPDHENTFLKFME